MFELLSSKVINVFKKSSKVIFYSNFSGSLFAVHSWKCSIWHISNEVEGSNSNFLSNKWALLLLFYVQSHFKTWWGNAAKWSHFKRHFPQKKAEKCILNLCSIAWVCFGGVKFGACNYHKNNRKKVFTITHERIHWCCVYDPIWHNPYGSKFFFCWFKAKICLCFEVHFSHIIVA